MDVTPRCREKDEKYAKITIVKAPAPPLRFFFVKITAVQRLHSISRTDGAQKTRPNHILKNVKGIRTPLTKVPLCTQVRNVNITGTGTKIFFKNVLLEREGYGFIFKMGMTFT